MRIADERAGDEDFGGGVFFAVSTGVEVGTRFFIFSRFGCSSAASRAAGDASFGFAALETFFFFGIICPPKIDGQDSTDACDDHAT
jgi:hypothetical protein